VAATQGVTGQLADPPAHGLPISRPVSLWTGQISEITLWTGRLSEWTARGLDSLWSSQAAD